MCMAESRKGQAGSGSARRATEFGDQSSWEGPASLIPALPPPRVLQGPCFVSAAKQEARLSDGRSPDGKVPQASPGPAKEAQYLGLGLWAPSRDPGAQASPTQLLARAMTGCEDAFSANFFPSRSHLFFLVLKWKE